MDCEFPVTVIDNKISFVRDMISASRLDAIISDQDYVILDSFRYFNKPASVYHAYFWLGQEIQKFVDLGYTDTVTTKYAVNFIINKKQINRYFAIKLVELYNLTASYTWSGIGANFDLSSVLADIQALPTAAVAKSFLLSSIKLDPHWIDLPGKVINRLSSDSSIIEYNGNLWAWTNGLDRIIKQSAVSLITESVQEQQCAVFTEKTLFSVLGLTFPIWIGGFGQAEEWARIGFDTFDDIINHDYQYRNTITERCWHAVADNSELLQDPARLSKLRQHNLPRLLKNRQLALNNIVGIHNTQLISTWPDDIKDIVLPMIHNLTSNSK